MSRALRRSIATGRTIGIVVLCCLTTAALSGCEVLSLIENGFFPQNRTMKEDRPHYDRSPSYAETSGAPPYAIRTMERSGTRDADGWSYLVEGRPARAMNYFETESFRHPRDGTPRIGAALAAALQGDHSCAVRTMREAIRIDPDSLESLRISAALKPKIDRLVDDYVDMLFKRSDDEDSRFMLATLHYLQRDTLTARRALGRPPAYGWAEISTHRLQELIDDHDSGSVAINKGRSPAPQRWGEVLSNTPSLSRSAVAQPSAEPVKSKKPAEGAEQPTRSSQPVDYDRLRRDLGGAAEALDRFNRKLIERMERFKSGPVTPEQGDTNGAGTSSTADTNTDS